jgi:hypothetical protein
MMTGLVEEDEPLMLARNAGEAPWPGQASRRISDVRYSYHKSHG